MLYIDRIVDSVLDELQAALPAISLEGPKAVGKTRTALRRAKTTYRLDDPAQREIVAADPARLVQGEPPILIDEWQRVPESWDIVRRAVDDDPKAGRFLLTGSATPSPGPTHSGAGRIVTVRMRPLTLAERGVETPVVSLRQLLGGGRPDIQGRTSATLSDYTAEIISSGFPDVRPLTGRPLREQLGSYLQRIVDVDFEEAGRSVREAGDAPTLDDRIRCGYSDIRLLRVHSRCGHRGRRRQAVLQRDKAVSRDAGTSLDRRRSARVDPVQKRPIATHTEAQASPRRSSSRGAAPRRRCRGAPGGY